MQKSKQAVNGSSFYLSCEKLRDLCSIAVEFVPCCWNELVLVRFFLNSPHLSSIALVLF